MRRRDHVIPLRLNEREYRHLCEQVKISGLSREEYLRSLILDKEIHPRPCTH
ncbi:plasmid mobilization protein, partial [Gemmiger sp.]|uniref:plasmid mobilization protein n=1 Tax=Gemmiger sp. TaxID=2049027 RepID=UPI003A93D208